MANLSSTQKLLLAFVTLIIGIIFIATIATQGLGIVTQTGVDDESHAIPLAGTNRLGPNINESYVYSITNSLIVGDWRTQTGNCLFTGVVIKNSTGDALTITTDYVFDTTYGNYTLVDTIEVNQTLFEDNLTYVDYFYCAEDYMNLGWGRTSIKLVPGFFAIALLLVSVGLFYSIGKENGLIN